jgi:hypothetical protein
LHAGDDGDGSKVPTEQLVQATEDARELKPARHDTQVCDVTAPVAMEKSPGAQAVQAVEVEEAAKVPAAQSVHAAANDVAL